MAEESVNIQFECDSKGRIVVARNSKAAINIGWADDNLDIDYCNLIIVEVCSNRGIAEE